MDGDLQRPVINAARDAWIPTVKIRCTRINQWAIGSHNSPRIGADAADLRGSTWSSRAGTKLFCLAFSWRPWRLCGE